MDTKEMIDRIEELENRVHNLTLYMQHIQREHPVIYHAMQAMYDGLPGYAPTE